MTDVGTPPPAPGATVTFPALFLELLPLADFAVTLNLTLAVFVELEFLDGKAVQVAEPDEQPTVEGRPGVGTLDERVQLVAFVVVAETFTDPPGVFTVGALTLTLVIVGFGKCPA